MLVAYAAGEGQKLWSVDFTQAFLYAPMDRELYIQLPKLPPEIAAGWGRGVVGKLNKALYGLCDAPRRWQRHLLSFLKDTLKADVFVTDRNMFRWKWRGQELLGCIHVDDILFTGPEDARKEFLRILRLSFDVTGGEEPCKKFLGYQIEYDDEKRTIKLHQGDFARNLLQRFGAWDIKPADTPLRVGAAPLAPWEGKATSLDVFDYGMFVGSVTWLLRTNPRLAFPVHELSRFVSNPGPEHVAAAHRVMANIRKDPEAGLTFHGSKAVLEQSYPHKHMLIASCDSGFSHVGEKAVSGYTILMNGAAVMHVCRAQSTVSRQSTESEVKSIAGAAEMIQSVVPVWEEMMGRSHPSVRLMTDNKGAKKQVEAGADGPASAAYLRSRKYAESKVYEGLLWLDHVPGEKNPADLATKQVRDISEFNEKNGVISGESPFLYESAQIAELKRKLRVAAG